MIEITKAGTDGKRLEKGDTIKCKDKFEALKLMKTLEKEGYKTGLNVGCCIEILKDRTLE